MELFTCKNASCKDKPRFRSVQEHFEHHGLYHSVGSRISFMCGFKACSCYVKSLEKYHKHVEDFHRNRNLASNEQSTAVSADSWSFKCAFPRCNYSAKSKGTLRAHYFWTHSKGGNSVSETSLWSSSTAASGHESFPVEIDEFVESEPAIQPATNVEHDLMATTADSPDDVLLKKWVHTCLTLTSKYHVPDSTLAYVLESYDHLLREDAKLTVDILQREIEDLGLGEGIGRRIAEKVCGDSILMKLHGFNGPMRSFYMRQQQYSKLFPYVAPVSRKLPGLNNYNMVCKYHTVPIKESLKALFEDDSVYHQYCDSLRRPLLSSDLTDIHSGSVFQNHSLFSKDPSALQIILYQDDVEMGNALGPAAGSYKLLHMAYTLGNLYSWNRSKVDPIQLVMLCKEKDVDYFGFPEVLKPVINELKELEDEGVEIRGKVVKASVLVLLGDNLGTHAIGGFTENFSKSKYFCRYCEESREQWKKRWYGQGSANVFHNDHDCDTSSGSDTASSEDSSTDEEIVEAEENAVEEGRDSNNSSDEDVPLADLVPLSALNKRLYESNAPWRSKNSYDECVRDLQANPGGMKGIVADSQLNKLNHFHVVDGTPPCISHDIFEGIAAYDLLLCIKKLKRKYKFSYDFLNRRIKSFQFLGTEKLDKPPPKFHSTRKKVKGNAIQNWVLLRFLPLLIGDQITDKKDPVWKMVLTLIETVSLLMSPVVSKNSLGRIDNLIHKYLCMRVHLFPKVPLRCKHHYFEHYKKLLEIFGSLARCSTLRFESKHKFFRSEFKAKKTVKNPTKTLARAHQQMQSAMKVQSIFPSAPFVHDLISFETLKVEADVLQCILLSFGEEYAKTLMYSEKITFHNTQYESGRVVVTSSVSYPHLDCCKLSLFMSIGNKAYAVGTKCVATLLKDMQVYELGEATAMTVIDLDTLKDYVPYAIYFYSHRSVIVLKHLYLQN